MYKITLIFLFAVLAHSLPAQKPKEVALYKSDTVFVQGLIQTPLTLTLKDLADLPIQTLDKFNIVTEGGEIKRTVDGGKGILLKDILTKAQVKMDSKKEQGRYFVVITATDGYQVIFAYDELMYGQAAKSAYLLWEEAGQTISDNGPFVVRCTSDLSSGPRYVKWVRSIEVRKI